MLDLTVLPQQMGCRKCRDGLVLVDKEKGATCMRGCVCCCSTHICIHCVTSESPSQSRLSSDGTYLLGILHRPVLEVRLTIRSNGLVGDH
jgi:hypothetical protein